MKIIHGTMETLQFTELERLDLVRLHYSACGRAGSIVIECYGQAWARHFADMGTSSVIEFLARCDVDYLSSAVAWPFVVPARLAAYRDRVCEAVVRGCKQWIAQNAGGLKP